MQQRENAPSLSTVRPENDLKTEFLKSFYLPSKIKHQHILSPDIDFSNSPLFPTLKMFVKFLTNAMKLKRQGKGVRLDLRPYRSMVWKQIYQKRIFFPILCNRSVLITLA